MGFPALQLPTVERPLLFKAALRLVSGQADKDDLEEAFAELLARIQAVSNTSTNTYVFLSDDDPALSVAAQEIAMLRTVATLLQEIIDSDMGVLLRLPEGEDVRSRLSAALATALERVNSRRAYLAWVLDEDDDRELGREIVLSELDATAGPSSPSFAW